MISSVLIFVLQQIPRRVVVCSKSIALVDKCLEAASDPGSLVEGADCLAELLGLETVLQSVSQR